METPGISVFQLKVFQKSSSKGVMLRHRVSADYSLHPFKGGSTEVGFITVYFTHLKDIWIKLPKSYGIQWKEKSTSQWSLISGGNSYLELGQNLLVAIVTGIEKAVLWYPPVENECTAQLHSHIPAHSPKEKLLQTLFHCNFYTNI